MCQFYSSGTVVRGIHENQPEIVWDLFLFHSAHHLFGSLQDSAHLSAAKELLSLPGLLAPKQQHVVCSPHISLEKMSYLYPEGSCQLWLSCLGVKACDEVCVVLVQSDCGAEVRLRLLRLGLRHTQLKLASLLGAEMMTISVITTGVSCEQGTKLLLCLNEILIYEFS